MALSLSPSFPYLLRPPPPRLRRAGLPRLPVASAFLISTPRCLTRSSFPAAAAASSRLPLPSDDDPPEAAEDLSHGFSRRDQFERHVERARRSLDADRLADGPLFPSNAGGSPSTTPPDDASDDLFGDIDAAIALEREELLKRRVLKQRSEQPPESGGADDELDPEEELDLQEIQELNGLSVVPYDESEAALNGSAFRASNSAQEDEQDGDFDEDETLEREPDDEPLPGLEAPVPPRILVPNFHMTIAELLDESKVVPLSAVGDLELLVSGIQHDSREVTAGDLFVCCKGATPSSSNGMDPLTEADKRGAVAVVADEEINIDDTLGCKALIIVEDTWRALPVLASAFYRRPSESMVTIGVTGTDGVTVTTRLIKAVYEAMGLRTGIIGKLGNYAFADNKLDAAVDAVSDPVMVHKLMATMVYNGTEAVVVDASSGNNDDPSLGNNEIDFDIAVFTNSRYDSSEFDLPEAGFLDSKAAIFAKMVDPERHRTVVNADDPRAPLFAARGSPDVPMVTYALENKGADVHVLKYELSLFETQVLVQTPQGVIEISSGLLGKNNIYNILAAVAVGITVDAPLESIVRGIEEVDAVPGRCELIDEEQAFGVVVDNARTVNSLSRLLDGVRELNPSRIITVIGCCGEKERGKRPLMTKLATDKSDVVMLTSDNPGSEDPLDILDDMLAGVGWTMADYLKHGENDYYPPLPNGHRLFLHDVRRVAVRAAVAMGEKGDVVVIAGKGDDTYQIEGDKKEFFDDREECREALQYVDDLHSAGIDTTEFPWRLPESH